MARYVFAAMAAVLALALPAVAAEPGIDLPRVIAPPPPGGAPGMEVTEFSSAGGHVYKIHFKKGDEVASGMNQFAQAHRFKQATLIGIGGFDSAMLAWSDAKATGFKSLPVNEKTEVASMVGTISTDAKGRTSFHAHVVLAVTDGTTRGGHLVTAVVNPTLEIYVTDLGEPVGKT